DGPREQGDGRRAAGDQHEDQQADTPAPAHEPEPRAHERSPALHAASRRPAHRTISVVTAAAATDAAAPTKIARFSRNQLLRPTTIRSPDCSGIARVGSPGSKRTRTRSPFRSRVIRPRSAHGESPPTLAST